MFRFTLRFPIVGVPVCFLLALSINTVDADSRMPPVHCFVLKRRIWNPYSSPSYVACVSIDIVVTRSGEALFSHVYFRLMGCTIDYCSAKYS